MAIIGFIYIIENTRNSKVYVGQTLYTDLNQRFHEHQVSANQKRLQNRPLYKAFCEIGVSAFSIRLVESCPIELLDERECYWINYYDSYNSGYNDTLGGVSRHRYSYEEIASDFLDGMTTKEICDKHGCTKTVIASALNAYSCSHHLNGSQINARTVIVKDKLTNQTIKRFPFLKAAAEWVQSHCNLKSSLHGIKSRICSAANPHNNRKSAYGYKWEYEETCCNIDNQDAGIYGVQDVDGRMLYIGHTRRSFSERWKEHLRKYMKLSWPLYNYIRENGIDTIDFVVVEEISPDAPLDTFIQREKYWIDYYDTDNEEWGLNLRKPVNTVKSHSYAEYIDEIYELLLSGATNSAIVAKFDITSATVSLIRNGKTYYNPDIDYPIKSNNSSQVSKQSKNKKKPTSPPRQYKLSGFTCVICGKALTTKQQKYCSNKCQHKAQKRPRPSRAELKCLIRSSSFTAIGRKYNVTDNAIRKWCKEYGLPSTTWEIQQYSDDEWEREEWNNDCNDTVPEQRSTLYDSIVRELLSCRNGKRVEEHQNISKGTMSTARTHHNLPYLPSIQHCSTSCYCEETQMYFMSAKDAATWLVEKQYGTSIDAIRSKIASAFRDNSSATLTLPTPSSSSIDATPSTFTFSPVPQSDFYSIIQRHHVISYAFDPKWRVLIENPALLPDFLSLDELPWVAEFKAFYGMDCQS